MIDTPEDRLGAMRDHAHTLSDFLVPTLSIECEPCGRAGRDTVARLVEKYGDAKLPELLHALASGRPSYPAQPSIIPSDKPPQRLRTSEPGTRAGSRALVRAQGGVAVAHPSGRKEAFGREIADCAVGVPAIGMN